MAIIGTTGCAPFTRAGYFGVGVGAGLSCFLGLLLPGIMAVLVSIMGLFVLVELAREAPKDDDLDRLVRTLDAMGEEMRSIVSAWDMKALGMFSGGEPWVVLK